MAERADFVFSVEELDRELIARGAQTPDDKLFKFEDEVGTPQRNKIFRQVKTLYHPANVPALNSALSHFTTPELLQKIRLAIAEMGIGGVRGTWYMDDRLDLFEVTDAEVIKNALSTAGICMKRDLSDEGSGFSVLKVKNYGATYNLCHCENFYNQPVAKGPFCTGILVADDIILTTTHYVKKNLDDICFIFGFVMDDPITPVIRIPNENIYRGAEVLNWKRDVKGFKATGSDWALVKLDRKVTGRKVAALSQKNVSCEQPIYAVGYPCGLPLKYAPGSVVQDVEKAFFMAEMDIYSSNSGSPVFCAETHELVGIVSQSDPLDFRWLDGCVISVIYPNDWKQSHGARIIKVSEFGGYFKQNRR